MRRRKERRKEQGKWEVRGRRRRERGRREERRKKRGRREERGPCGSLRAACVRMYTDATFQEAFYRHFAVAAGSASAVAAHGSGALKSE